MGKANEHAMRYNLNKLFDKWYAQNRPKSPNRIRLVQRAALAPLNGNEEAIFAAQERDRKLKIDRKKGKSDGTDS